VGIRSGVTAGEVLALSEPPPEQLDTAKR